MVEDQFYKVLEDTFRGDNDLIKSRLAVYVPFLSHISSYTKSNKIIDLGCGRGEWIEICMNYDVIAVGVDLNHAMIADANCRGLPVERSEAVQYLKGIENESVGLITGFHILEHLSFNHMHELLVECFRCLEPGGIIIFETPNPENISIGTCGFNIDPTHNKPLPPTLLKFVVDQLGFARSNIMRLNEDAYVNIKKSLALSDVLYGVSPDYSVIAQKSNFKNVSEIDLLFDATIGLTLGSLAHNYDGNIRELRESITKKDDDIYEIRESIRNLDSNIHELKESLKNYDGDIYEIRESIRNLDSNIHELKESLKDYDGDICELRESIKDTNYKGNEFAASLKEQGEWVLDFSQEHAKQITALNARVQTLDEKICKLESSSLISIPSFINNKLKELYWTVTRAMGLGYFHDGTVSKKSNVEVDKIDNIYISSPSSDRSSVFNLSLLRIEQALLYWSKNITRSNTSDSYKKLAIITPMPPQKTGVADYSNELVPSLANYYDITIISENAEKVISPLPNSIEVRSVEWFENHAYLFDRVLYQFGNSEFHAYMLPLLKKFPGIIVLHDFFLGHLVGYLNSLDINNGIWNDELYLSEGYGALVRRSSPNGDESVLQDCPVNFTVMQHSLGVVFHNQYSLDLVDYYYDQKYIKHCRIVPHGRVIPSLPSRVSSRNKLQIDENDIVICSFGFLGPNKLSAKIFEAWKRVRVPHGKCVKLIYVGASSDSIYCHNLIEEIGNCGDGKVHITGYVSKEIYDLYLASCDLAIQLRANTRGETSGATLDCMSAGIPTIICDHGPFSEIPDECVIKISEPVSAENLKKNIEKLIHSPEIRLNLKDRASSYVIKELSISKIAPMYANIIEDFYLNGPKISDLNTLSNVAKSLNDLPLDNRNLFKSSEALIRDFEFLTPKKQLLIDISAYVREDLNTGVQRVVKCQLKELLSSPPEGFRIEPIYLVVEKERAFFRYANKLVLQFLELNDVHLDDRAISYGKDDIYYMPDLCYWSVNECHERGIYEQMYESGIKLNFIVFDNLPLIIPNHFPEGAPDMHKRWLDAILCHADKLICISNTVKTDVLNWIEENNPKKKENLKVDVLYLGSDFKYKQTINVSSNSKIDSILNKVNNKITFLMVGTIEPRKGYLQVLDAFDELWSQNYDVNLLIVGSEGWKGLEDDKRRTIPLILDRLRHHPNLDKNLFWVNDSDDTVLHKLYSIASCFLMASENEGFGLPLVEALHYDLPIIARDLPVFREILGKNATYFISNDGKMFAEELTSWLNKYNSSAIQIEKDISWINWNQNVEILKKKLLSN